MFGHDICLKGRLDTFSTFSAFKIHNSVSLLVKITKKPNSIGRPSWCFAPKQSSNFATGCDVINRWIIGTRNKYRALLESWAPPDCKISKTLGRGSSRSRGWARGGRPPYFSTKMRPQGPKKMFLQTGPPLSEGDLDPPLRGSI